MSASTAPAGGYVVGAYPASPAAAAWDPDLEAEYYAALATDPRITALEIPWPGRLHPHDESWLLGHLPERMDVVLTGIPRVVVTVRDDPRYGLASLDTEGREAALRDISRLRDDVHRVNDATGRRAVRTVELHSAPRATQGSSAALAESLRGLAAGEWEGADLVIEHCDALVAGLEPQKGFLGLPAEIEAIRASGTGTGLVLNWGRSAIELRNPARVPEHVVLAREAGLLRGFAVSGASDRAGHYPAWADGHARFRRSAEHPFGDADSLLTEETLRPAVEAAGPDVWLGLKVTWPTAEPGTVAERAAMIRDALDALDRVAAGTKEEAR